MLPDIPREFWKVPFFAEHVTAFLCLGDFAVKVWRCCRRLESATAVSQSMSFQKYSLRTLDRVYPAPSQRCFRDKAQSAPRIANSSPAESPFSIVQTGITHADHKPLVHLSVDIISLHEI